MKTNGHDQRTAQDNATRMAERRAVKEAKRKRAEAIFAADPDLPNNAIATRMGVSNDCISEWRKQWRKARGGA